VKFSSIGLLALLASLPLLAQKEISPQNFTQPGPKDIVIAGNTLSQSVTCKDSNAVYVEGQRNEVQVHGQCSVVRIQGEANHVWVDQRTYVPVEGNDNVVFVSDPNTQYSSRGNGNRFERSKH
jgi:hypothetical protein